MRTNSFFRKYSLLALVMSIVFVTSCDKDKDDYEVKPKTYLDHSDFVTNGMVAYLPLNEGEVCSLGDDDCSVNGTVFTSDRFGHSSGAVFFDGVDDFIELPSLDRLNGTSGTICFWIRLDDGSRETPMAIISKIDEQSVGYNIATSDSKTIFFETLIEGGASNSLDFGKDISDKDENYFLTVTFTENSINTFFQGQPSHGFSITSDWLFSNSLPAVVGKSLLDNQTNFSGDIDDIIIYNRVLTNEEILRLSEWR